LEEIVALPRESTGEAHDHGVLDPSDALDFVVNFWV
jgi:hypothetical protein